LKQIYRIKEKENDNENKAKHHHSTWTGDDSFGIMNGNVFWNKDHKNV